MSSYSELLKRPEWNIKRIEILKRDNFTCQLCNTTYEEMHVHHLYYEDHWPPPWEYDNEALITLCANCHEKEEFHKVFTNHGIHYLTTLGVMHTDMAEIIGIISTATDREDFHSMREYIGRFIKHARHA